jgi:hypothetical protein
MRNQRQVGATYIEAHLSDRQKCKHLLGLDHWNLFLGYWIFDYGESKNNFRCRKGSGSLLSAGQVSILTFGKSSGNMLDDVVSSLPILLCISTRPFDDCSVRVFNPAESKYYAFRLSPLFIVERDLDLS